MNDKKLHFPTIEGDYEIAKSVYNEIYAKKPKTNGEAIEIMREGGNIAWADKYKEFYSECHRNEKFGDLPYAPKNWMAVHELFHLYLEDSHSHIGEQDLSIRQYITMIGLKDGREFSKAHLTDIVRLSWDSIYKQMYQSKSSPFNKDNVSLSDLEQYKIPFSREELLTSTTNSTVYRLVSETLLINVFMKDELGTALHSVNYQDLKNSSFESAEKFFNLKKQIDSIKWNDKNKEFYLEKGNIPQSQLKHLEATSVMLTKLENGVPFQIT